MKNFAHIVMLYNLDDSSFGESSEALRLAVVSKQLEKINSDIRLENIILIEHRPLKAKSPIDKDFSNTIVWELIYKENGDFVNKKKVYNFGLRNVGDGDSLSCIFLAIKERFRAAKYVLYIYNHSNFVGHLTSRVLIRGSVQYRYKYEEVAPQFVHDNIELTERIRKFDKFHEISEDTVQDYIDTIVPQFGDANNDMLTNAELADALDKAFRLNPIAENEQQKVEAVFFNTCYTANLENLYLYAKCVRYIVASEGEIHFNSFDISKIIQRFRTGETTEEILNGILGEFRSNFRRLNPDSIIYRRMMIHAFDLNRFDSKAFTRIFNDILLDFFKDITFITNSIISKQSNPHQFIPDCFRLFNKYSPKPLRNQYYTHTYDFFRLFEFFRDTYAERNQGLADRIVQLLSFVKSCVLKTPFVGSEVNIKSFDGLSIYLNNSVNQMEEKRRDQIAYNYSFYSRFRHEFARLTLWPEFIQLYEKSSLA